MKVINLFGGPGAGKSTTSAGLFHIMKLKKMNCELVTEFAKDLTWENRYIDLENQIYVLGEQLKRLKRLEGKVEYAITDSPLLLGTIYGKHMPKSYEDLTMDIWNTFDNVNFYIKREKEYIPIGRNQTEEEAKSIDNEVYDMLVSKNVDYHNIRGNEGAPHVILDILLKD